MNDHTQELIRPGSVTSVDDDTTIVPLGAMVLIKPDATQKQTSAGIILPDNLSIPNCRGRVIDIGYAVLRMWDQAEVPEEHRFRKLDRVIFHFNGAMPESFEKISDGRVLVPVGNILAKVVKHAPSARK